MSNEVVHTEFCVKSGEKMLVNGVVGIESFESSYVELELSDNRMTIEGENMKIESLDHSTGHLTIKGKIQGVYYSKQNRKNGFWAKIIG